MESLTLENIDAFIFDFDGVLTNNSVHLDQDGREFVSCSRADGLAFDVLRILNKPAYILSTEQNKVVTARANKLQVHALQGVENKAGALKRLALAKGFQLRNILYVGNDLNDYAAMQLCGYAVCPADSHKIIKDNSCVILKTKGGNGVVRELLEDILRINFIQILYS